MVIAVSTIEFDVVGNIWFAAPTNVIAVVRAE